MMLLVSAVKRTEDAEGRGKDQEGKAREWDRVQRRNKTAD